jgi:hypothetical protein
MRAGWVDLTADLIEAAPPVLAEALIGLAEHVEDEWPRGRSDVAKRLRRAAQAIRGVNARKDDDDE